MFPAWNFSALGLSNSVVLLLGVSFTFTAEAVTRFDLRRDLGRFDFCRSSLTPLYFSCCSCRACSLQRTPFFRLKKALSDSDPPRACTSSRSALLLGPGEKIERGCIEGTAPLSPPSSSSVCHPRTGILTKYCLDGPGICHIVTYIP